MRSNLLNLVGGVAMGLVALGFVSGCDDKPAAKPTTSKPAPTGKSTAAAKPTATTTAAADKGGKMTAEQASEKLFDFYKQLAELIDKHGKDCKKLGEELKKFAEKDENAKKMKQIAEDGGGKPMVEQAMEKKFGDKYEEVSDKILEATEIDCAKDKGVKEAAKLMDL